MLSYEYTFDEKQVAAGDKTASPPPLVIQQDPDGVLASGVGATVWDSALVLAKYFELLAGEDEDGNHGRDLMQEPSRSLKKLLGSASTVLELGSGTGILGLLVAQMKSILFQSLSTVILTDKYMKLIETNLDTCKTKQTQQNGHDVEIVAEKLDWTTDVSIRRPPDVILIADCIHWPEMFQPLITTLLSLTSSSPSTSTVILIAYERREFGVEASFFKMLGEHFTFTHIPETQQHPVYSSDDIYLFIARRKQSNKTKNRE